MAEPKGAYGASPEEAHYHQAKADPIAAVILDALYEQDARTYNGISGDKGELALRVASDLREPVASEPRMVGRLDRQPRHGSPPSARPDRARSNR
jgi:hypothetical protein